MKFIISTQELNTLINKLQNIISLKATLPILNNFLLEAYDDGLTLSATDLVMSIQCRLETPIIEEGGTTLPGKRFGQLIREIIAPTIEISSNKEDVTTLTAGSSYFKLYGMNKQEYPVLSDLSNAPFFTIKQAELKQLLYRTSFAVAREDTRYPLTGIYMETKDNTVTFIGTDGKRLSKAHASIQSHANALITHSIIPLKAIEEIAKNLHEDGDAKVFILSDKIEVEMNQTRINTRLLPGEYPDISPLIPSHITNIAACDREELISSLRQISLFIPDPQHSVRFTFSNGQLILSAMSSEIGEGNISLPIDYKGPYLEIAFNPFSFIEILRRFNSKTSYIELKDSYNLGILLDETPSENKLTNTSLAMLMPMRLKD